VEAGLVEQPGGVQPLGRLVAVEAAGVGGEIDEAEQDRRRDDRGQRRRGRARPFRLLGIAGIGPAWASRARR
jgi:hypothetical protein